MAELHGKGHGRLHLPFLAIQLDQQHRRRIGRVFLDAKGIVDGLDAIAVHHFHACGQDTGRRHQPHGVSSRLHGGEVGQQHGDALGAAQQAQGDGGGDAQGAFAADKRPPQIQLRGLIQLAAQGHHAAIGKHHLHGEHVVTGDPIFEAVHAAGVFGDVAADAAGHLAGGIGGVIKAIPRNGSRHPTVDHPGLHGDAAILEIHRKHPAHPAGGDHEGFGFSHGAPGEARATAAGHKGHPALVAKAEHRRHLFSGLGQHHQRRLMAVQGEAIAVVGKQLLARRHHRLGRQDPPELALELGPIDAHPFKTRS